MANIEFRKKLLSLALDINKPDVTTEFVDEQKLVIINSLRDEDGVVLDIINEFRGEVEDILSFWAIGLVKTIDTPFGNEKYMSSVIKGQRPDKDADKYVHVLGVLTKKEGMTHFINYEIKKRIEKRKELNKVLQGNSTDLVSYAEIIKAIENKVDS